MLLLGIQNFNPKKVIRGYYKTFRPPHPPPPKKKFFFSFWYKSRSVRTIHVSITNIYVFQHLPETQAGKENVHENRGQNVFLLVPSAVPHVVPRSKSRPDDPPPSHRSRPMRSQSGDEPSAAARFLPLQQPWTAWPSCDAQIVAVTESVRSASLLLREPEGRTPARRTSPLGCDPALRTVHGVRSGGLFGGWWRRRWWCCGGSLGHTRRGTKTCLRWDARLLVRRARGGGVTRFCGALVAARRRYIRSGVVLCSRACGLFVCVKT